MKKIISLIGMFAVLGVAAGDARGVAMTANIRRLLQEKQDKIAKLEECEGKKQGWMIAGISTIGLTAVGVGVNIAQASKSNRLSDEIEMEKTTLQRQQDELDRIQNDIAAEQAKKAEEERKRAEEERRRSPVNVGGGVETSVVDGVIGEKCNDDKGVWLTAIEGNDKKCSNSTSGEIVDCKCVETICTEKNTLGENSSASKPAEISKPGQGSIQKTTSPGSATNTGDRVVGEACIAEDINRLKPYGWLEGHYQKVGESVKTTLGVRCETKKGAGDSVNCSCRADKCDTNKGYDVDGNGLCVKKKVEQKEEKKEELKQQEQKTAEKKQEEKKQESAEKKEEPKSKAITLDAAVAGIRYCYYAIDGYESVSSSDCSVSKSGDWGVTFPDYTVFGTAVCNGNTGTYAEASKSEQTETGGENCWCKMEQPLGSRWVFFHTSISANLCTRACAGYCADRVQNHRDFRGAVFGAVK